MLSSLLSPHHLEKLIAERKLLCILNPQLRDQIRRYQGNNSYVVLHNDQVYLSLEHIEDEKQREYYYQLIQRYQLGQEVNLVTLPGEMQQILQPEVLPQALFWGPLILGSVGGLVVGVLAMAVAMLFWNATAVTLGTVNPDHFNIQIPTIIFVFFAAFGWIVTSFIAWRRMRASLKT